MARRDEKPAPKSDAAKTAGANPSNVLASRERSKLPAGRAHSPPAALQRAAAGADGDAAFGVVEESERRA